LFTNVNQYGRFLRVKTYSLGSALEVKKFFNFRKKGEQPAKLEEIIDAVDPVVIRKEVEQLHEHLLFRSRNFAVYCAPTVKMPNILNELGRLREITFREVGEGTNRSIDIDEFDLYYHQMFIWDEEAHRIVGAYRVGKGKEIVDQYGIKGFYLQTLFRMKKGLCLF